MTARAVEAPDLGPLPDYTPLDHAAMTAIHLPGDVVSDTKARMAYARNVEAAVASYYRAQMIAALAEAEKAPEPTTDGINVERLRRALALAGCASDESAESIAANMATHVNRLTLALLDAPPVPKETQALWDACKKAADAERHACSIVVWMAKMEASEPDADDLGVSGWLDEAETRIKRRAGPPEAPFWPSELRDMLMRSADRARDALVSGDFDKARPNIAALASFAGTVAAADRVPDFRDS